MDITAALFSCGGVARTAALLDLGVRKRAITAAVAEGRVRRVHRGVFALADAEPSLVAAVSLSGRVTCVTALARHDVRLLQRTGMAHIAVAGHHSSTARRWTGVRLHYRSLTQANPAAEPGPPVATVAQALDDAGRCLDEVAHLVAVDSALHQGLVHAGEVAQFRCSPRSRADWLLAHMDGRAESVGETLARLSCVRRGLAVHPQRFIAGVGRVDLVVDDRVVVEVDGFSAHADAESFWRDRKRGRGVTREGLPVLRFAHRELLGGNPVDVGREVEEVIESVRSRRSIQ